MALTFVVICTVLSAAGALAAFAWFGVLFGPASSWSRPIDWIHLIIVEVVAAAPSLIGLLVAGAVVLGLEDGDEGYKRATFGVLMALGGAFGAPALSIGAILVAHGVG